MTEQERKAPLEMKDITVDVGAVSREEAIEKIRRENRRACCS